MDTLPIPDFGRLLAPFIGRVPPEAMPRFLALLERGAADRYRYWAEQLPEHAAGLAECARREDEIADRIEAAFTLDESLREVLHAPLPEAVARYRDTFAPYSIWDQLRIQADAERQGARAWRNIASRHPDPRVIDVLHSCSALEEESADHLDDLIRRAAPHE